MKAVQLGPWGGEPVSRMVAAFQSRRDLVIPALGEMPGIALENNVEGAFYAFASIQDLVENSNGKIQNGWDFAETLLESEGVAVVPGEAFGANNHFRVSFATSTEVSTESVDCIDREREREARRVLFRFLIIIFFFFDLV